MKLGLFEIGNGGGLSPSDTSSGAGVFVCRVIRIPCTGAFCTLAFGVLVRKYEVSLVDKIVLSLEIEFQKKTLR